MKIEVLQGDITTLPVDAIVNAANSSLMGGGGVDGAIHRVGGPAILNACKAIRQQAGDCPPGEAVITPAGLLPAKYVIHTVGPVWHNGRHHEPELLERCYRNCLMIAEQHAIKSISFPNISTGVYGFPKERAASIALDTVRQTPVSSIERLYFVCFDSENYRLYHEMIHPG